MQAIIRFLSVASLIVVMSNMRATYSPDGLNRFSTPCVTQHTNHYVSNACHSLLGVAERLNIQIVAS